MVNLIFITEFIEYVAQGSLLKPNDLSNLSECFTVNSLYYAIT